MNSIDLLGTNVQLFCSIYCTMLSGIRKFCDYHRTCQFLFKRIIDMFADCLIVTSKQNGYLLTSQPYHVVLQTDIHLRLSVLCLIYDDLIIRVHSLMN